MQLLPFGVRKLLQTLLMESFRQDVSYTDVIIWWGMGYGIQDCLSAFLTYDTFLGVGIQRTRALPLTLILPPKNKFFKTNLLCFLFFLRLLNYL